MISRRGVAKKRRKRGPGMRTVKCSPTVAVTQQSWRQGNHLIMEAYGNAAGPSLAVIRAANPATGIPQVVKQDTYARLALGEMIAATRRSSRVRIHVGRLRDHSQQAECHRVSRAANVMPCRDDARGESPIPFLTARIDPFARGLRTVSSRRNQMQQRLTSIVMSAIASFLCSRHFLRQLLSVFVT
jgi:hypothetical protein